MDLKSRLARLPQPRAPSAPSGSPEVATGEKMDRQLVDHQLVEREGTLASLREQMASILGRPSPPPRPIVDPSIGELPFVRSERAEGPLFRRIQHFGSSHHIGRIPVDAALAARAEALALLALDPSLAATDPRGALFLDTETTGLGGSGTLAFLVGLGAFEDGAFVVEQLLLRTPGEERSLLAHVAERLEAASLVVTFNGKAFDLPTLATRYVMNRMPPPPARPHLDLLHIGRRLHRTRLGSCTLKALEADVLGFVRDGDIDGGDVAPRYTHFLRTGDDSVLRAVVDHNAWDVVSMAALVGLYGEPLGTLHHDDLVGLARTYRRARAFDEAEQAAETAVQRGAGPAGLRVRGDIAKARGDRKRALADYETLADSVDDPTVRLELAKLYEHFVKEPDRALELLQQGTGEHPEALERRRTRLTRKSEKRRNGA